VARFFIKTRCSTTVQIEPAACQLQKNLRRFFGKIIVLYAVCY